MNYLKKHPEYLWLAAILTLSTLLRLAFLHEPFEMDEGQYAGIAQEILRGGLPYRDAIEIKPPGAFYLYALAITTFGATTEAIRIFTALYAGMTLLAVYAVTRALSGVRGALWGALIFGVYSTFPLLQGSGCNTEVFLLLPLTAGAWFFITAADQGKRSYLHGAGLCAGIALLIKPVALPLVALQLLLILFLPPATGRIKSAALNLAAFILPLGLCALATFSYFFLKGGLDDLLYWTFEFPRHYRESGAGGLTPAKALNYLASSLLVPALLGLPSALWLGVTRRTMAGIFPLALLLAASLAVTLPGKYFPHYFITLLPFLAIPGGVGLGRILEMTGVPRILALLILLAAVALSVEKNYKFYVVYSPETVSLRKYGVPLFVESAAVARYLREHTRPDEYIFQWGMAPELYFLADRRFPNPFLGSLVPGWSRNPDRAAETLLQSLNQKRPAYLVVQPECADFRGEKEVSSYLQTNCSEETRIGYAILFRCR